MKPCLKPKLSITTFTTGTRQFVVQERVGDDVVLGGMYFS